MNGYQDFVDIFGCGKFIESKDIDKKYCFQKALASLYIIPSFYRSIYYILNTRERKGHFIENKQEFFTSLFDTAYGKNKWYWGLSSAARLYGIEWSATKLLELVVLDRSKTIHVSEKIRCLQKKKSYRSATLATYYTSLDVNIIIIHKSQKISASSIKIDDSMGPVSSIEQLQKDIKIFSSKIRNPGLKKIFSRIDDAINKL